MGRIKRLNEHLSNLIAAGEVVERPASVVKELVENAIDANSTVIEIALEEAGLTSIRIVDNGDGIAEEDCLLAFDRHATSKIHDENDLFRIRTLGFRGEALPSIAAVSELEIITSTGQGAGTRLMLRGGDILHHDKAPSRKGTEITVRQLFFNTPARLKYMKTINTELGNITDIVYRLAMSHPDISFRLLHNDKKLLHTSGNGDIRQVLAAIYGIAAAKKMLPIRGESLDFTITGYVALPEVTRASRNYISTIVNGRYVKNFSLVKAIQQGYHTLLPIGRYPIGLLSIVMDPMLVDVNVHPSKLEVRFSKEAELLKLTETVIRQALHQVQLIPNAAIQTTKKPREESVQEAFQFQHPASSLRQPTVPHSLFTTDYKPSHVELIQETPSFVEALEDNYEEIPTSVLEPQQETFVSESVHIVQEDIAKEKKPQTVAANELPPLYPIGQMHGTYILAQNEHGLYIIDQHAAQERIHYEYFRDKVARVTSDVQELLVPYRIDVSLSEFLRIEEQLFELQKVGLFLEPFGHQSFLVRSHPTWFPKGHEVEIIEEMMEQVLKLKRVDIGKLREEAAIMMSCKASIKANQYITNEEIFALLEDLRKTTNPYTCPHGRPIIVHHSSYELEKMFKRV